MPEDKPEPLTLEQKEQLETELAELEGPRRKAIVEAIATARGFGDLSENFEYHAAKNEQGLLERRITMLRDRLTRAVIVDPDPVCRRRAVDRRVAAERRVRSGLEVGRRVQALDHRVGRAVDDRAVALGPLRIALRCEAEGHVAGDLAAAGRLSR